MLARTASEQFWPCVRARLDAHACKLACICGACLVTHVMLVYVACDGMLCVDVMHAMRDIHAVK